MLRIKLFIILVLGVITTNMVAQETKPKNFKPSLGADFASEYLWRGFSLGKGPAVQPWGELTYKGFTIGAWGSSELNGSFKEVDLYGKYTSHNFSLMFVDLFFPGFEGLNQHFFNFNNTTTGHGAELGLSFNGTEKIPFSIYGGIILYGVAIDQDPRNTEKVNHSPYFEVKYLGNINDYSYNVFLGFTPVKSSLYQTNGFAVFNAGIGAQKTVKVTENFSFPLKLSLSTNPALEKIYLTLLISL